VNAPDPKKRTSKAPAGLAAALAVLLAAGVEGREHWPYYDQAGILTVCGGITGPGVVKGKFYSWGECDKLEPAYIERMNATIGKCIAPGTLTFKGWLWWGHFTYNVGEPTFCKSTAAKLLRAGKYEDACRQMARWTFITKPGRGSVNCRVKAEKCGGIPKRRDLEMKGCLAAEAEAR
jgi:lysozyme